MIGYRVIVFFVFLFTCSSCNPYASRRIPFGNSPYMSCKNCHKTSEQKLSTKQENYIYDFVGEENQKEIKPLPVPKRKITRKNVKTVKKRKKTSNKKVYTNSRTKSTHPYGKIKTQDLSKTKQESEKKLSSESKSKKKTGYISLSDSPERKYPTNQQKKMLTDKNADIKELSDRAKQVTNPNVQSNTLEVEQTPATPTKKGMEQLDKKLQELQRVTQKQGDDSVSQQSSVQQQKLVKSEQKNTPIKEQNQANIQPKFQSQPSSQSQSSAEGQGQISSQLKQTPIKPQQDLMKLQQQKSVEKQPPQSSVGLQSQRSVSDKQSLTQSQQDTAQKESSTQSQKTNSKESTTDSFLSTYNLKNKPIPLPQ